MTSISDLQKMAVQVAALPTLKRRTIGDNEATYKYWLAHPDVGPFATNEFTVDEGGKAVITLIGKVIWWKGGDEVVVLPS